MRHLLAYTIASAGWNNADHILRNVSTRELDELEKLLYIWMDGRSVADFFETLFGTYGYRCDEVSPSFEHSPNMMILAF